MSILGYKLKVSSRCHSYNPVKNE